MEECKNKWARYSKRNRRIVIECNFREMPGKNGGAVRSGRCRTLNKKKKQYMETDSGAGVLLATNPRQQKKEAAHGTCCRLLACRSQPATNDGNDKFN